MNSVSIYIKWLCKFGAFAGRLPKRIAGSYFDASGVISAPGVIVVKRYRIRPGYLQFTPGIFTVIVLFVPDTSVNSHRFLVSLVHVERPSDEKDREALARIPRISQP
jgi:hypothetical protein